MPQIMYLYCAPGYPSERRVVRTGGLKFSDEIPTGSSRGSRNHYRIEEGWLFPRFGPAEPEK